METAPSIKDNSPKKNKLLIKRNIRRISSPHFSYLGLSYKNNVIEENIINKEEKKIY